MLCVYYYYYISTKSVFNNSSSLCSSITGIHRMTSLFSSSEACLDVTFAKLLVVAPSSVTHFVVAQSAVLSFSRLSIGWHSLRIYLVSLLLFGLHSVGRHSPHLLFVGRRVFRCLSVFHHLSQCPLQNHEQNIIMLFHINIINHIVEN